MVLPATDGVVTLRASTPADVPTLVAGRDEVSRRWLGEGDPSPAPTACITVGAEIVGWVDFDVDRSWLRPGEVNVGYNVFPDHRGNGYATRAVQLLMHHLAKSTSYTVATLLIGAENWASQALAARAGFPRVDDLDGHPYFKRPVPPLTYTDDVVTLRPQTVDDVDAHLASIDDEQIRWMWLPGQRESWEAMSSDEQHAHVERWLATSVASFGHGPRWTFAIDTADTPYVAYADCDLSNPGVPAGEANISYSTHPAHRGNGYAACAVRLVVRFLRDHTGAREAHIGVDAENEASLRVARSAGAAEVERYLDGEMRTMVRHVVRLG